MLGLTCVGKKCKVLCIGEHEDVSLDGCLGGDTPELVSELRFLGLKIDTSGNIS
jgi:hypothetical protein